MDKKIKVSVLKTVARLGEKAAKIGCNSASLFGFHQPKEPVQAKKILLPQLNLAAIRRHKRYKEH